MTATNERIMAGDLSGRLAVTGSGDEFDRLANSLNAMLERIEALMAGLKQVSDNIAHDLKTPLTRLRNRAEEALRTAKSETDYRARAGSDDRGIGRPDPHLQRAADDRARGSGRGASRHDRFRRRSSGARASPSSTSRSPRKRACGWPPISTAPLPFTAAASWSARRSPTSSTTPSNMAPPSRPAEKNEIRVATHRENGSALLTVADHGRGIPAEDRGRAIERFVRLEPSRSRPGVGLGLSPASAVARLHGGELRLEDNSPGLRVTLALPAQRDEGA